MSRDSDLLLWATLYTNSGRGGKITDTVKIVHMLSL